MWARVVEFMLGCWILCSPFIFRAENREGVSSLFDFGIGGVIVVLASLAFWEPTRYAHLGTLVLSLLMILVPRFTLSPEIPPAGQNFMMVGFLLLMFSLIPNKAFSTPRAWNDALTG